MHLVLAALHRNFELLFVVILAFIANCLFLSIHITATAPCIELPKNKGKTRSYHNLRGLFTTKHVSNN